MNMISHANDRPQRVKMGLCSPVLNLSPRNQMVCAQLCCLSSARRNTNLSVCDDDPGSYLFI
jgi:hypothetical protein